MVVVGRLEEVESSHVPQVGGHLLCEGAGGGQERSYRQTQHSGGGGGGAGLSVQEGLMRRLEAGRLYERL